LVKQRYSIMAQLAYLVIVITALKISSNIILPFMMAIFLFVIFLPIMNKLNSYKLPNSLTSLIIFSIIVIVLYLFGSFLISSSHEIGQNIPLYQEQFHKLSPKIVEFFDKFNIQIDKENLLSMIEPAKILSYSTNIFKSMGSVAVNLFLTLALILFLLLESKTIFEKILYLAKTKNQQHKLESFFTSVNRYFVIKTFTSFLTALIVYMMLKYFDLQYALLFSVLAFVLNYIPSIGSIIAAFPPLFIAILQLSMMDTIMLSIGYFIINVFIGSFLDPKLMGQGLGLSTLVVFVSMVFWGWIFGPIGMLLAVPLTIVIKIASDKSDNYHWLSVMLSDKVE